MTGLGLGVAVLGAFAGLLVAAARAAVVARRKPADLRGVEAGGVDG